MPRIIETTVYKFEELSDKAKQAAVQMLSILNATDEWWDYIYGDAERIGIKIQSFDDYNLEAVFILAAKFKAHSPHDEGQQHQQQR